MPGRAIRIGRSSASTRPQSKLSLRRARRSRRRLGGRRGSTTNTVRNGTANLFMMYAPLEGWRHVKVTDRRATVDYAHALKDLADAHFPAAERIVLVQDNLNTHCPASLYGPFPPPRRATSSSGSNGITRPSTEAGSIWPESELGVLAGQCLDQRIPDRQTITDQVAA